MIFKLHMLGAHTFMSVDASDNVLVLSVMGSKEFAQILEENPEMIKHEVVNGNVILTAEPKGLQLFVKEHVNDKTIFGVSVKLNKKMTGGE